MSRLGKRSTLLVRFPQLALDYLMGVDVDSRYMHAIKLNLRREISHSKSRFSGSMASPTVSTTEFVKRYLLHNYNLIERGVRPPFYVFPYHFVLYLLCRKLRPTVVVETGVHWGVSSSFILQALHDNNDGGFLYSVTLPTTQELPNRAKGPGFIVPKEFEKNWKMILGDARQVLPSLLEGLDPIGLFAHDSDHSYEHMTFEFGEAWKHLQPGGVIVADNVDFNGALRDFSGSHGVTGFEIPQLPWRKRPYDHMMNWDTYQMGVMIKPNLERGN